MAQQTAVSWLIDQIKNKGNQEKYTTDDWVNIIAIAKDIEKDQIISSYNDGYKDGQSDPDTSKNISDFSNAKLYYDEAYE